MAGGLNSLRSFISASARLKYGTMTLFPLFQSFRCGDERPVGTEDFSQISGWGEGGTPTLTWSLCRRTGRVSKSNTSHCSYSPGWVDTKDTVTSYLHSIRALDVRYQSPVECVRCSLLFSPNVNEAPGSCLSNAISARGF